MAMTKAERSKRWYQANKARSKLMSRAWVSSHKEAVRIIKRRYYDSHREEVKAFARRYSRDNKLKRLDWRFKKLYGITFDEYSVMVIEQLGCCFICKLPTYELGVDHNHKTNKVRRLLCGSCNRGIGLLRDSPELCEMAAAYLKEYAYA